MPLKTRSFISCRQQWEQTPPQLLEAGWLATVKCRGFDNTVSDNFPLRGTLTFFTIFNTQLTQLNRQIKVQKMLNYLVHHHISNTYYCVYSDSKNRYIGLFQKNGNTQNKHIKCLDTLTTVMQKGCLLCGKPRECNLNKCLVISKDSTIIPPNDSLLQGHWHAVRDVCR